MPGVPLLLPLWRFFVVGRSTLELWERSVQLGLGAGTGGTGGTGGNGGMLPKVAASTCSGPIVTVHAPAPEQPAPDQPAKVEAGPGVAASVTCCPSG